MLEDILQTTGELLAGGFGDVNSFRGCHVFKH